MEPQPTPDCAQFTPNLPLLDLRLLSEHDAVRLNAHVAGCAYCQRERARYQRIDATLRRSLSQPIPVFARNDLQRMLQSSALPQRRYPVSQPHSAPVATADPAKRRWQLAMALFAALFVITGMFAVLALRIQPPATTPGSTQTVLVPNFVGSGLTAAQTKAKDVGLQLNVVYQQASAAANTIIDQSPAVGTSLAVNGTVTVTVSSGPNTIQVPNVAGETKAQACASLQKVNLRCEIAESATNSIYPPGTVDHTDPPGGALVPANSTVSLFISEG